MSDILTVNSYFDQVYLLNLDRRPDRLEKTSKKLEKLNIKFRRFSAIDGNSLKNPKVTRYGLVNKFALACLLSHIEIIKDAKKNNYKSVLIFEDDIMISEKFNEYFQKIKQLNDWEMIYLGASLWGDWNRVEFKDGFYLADEKAYSLSTFAYAVNCNIYDKILNAFGGDILNQEKAIDNLHYTCIHPNKKCYVFYPNIVISDVHDSNIRNSRDNLSHGEKMRWNLLSDYV